MTALVRKNSLPLVTLPPAKKKPPKFKVKVGGRKEGKRNETGGLKIFQKKNRRGKKIKIKMEKNKSLVN